MDKLYEIDLTDIVNEIEALNVSVNDLTMRLDAMDAPEYVDVKEFAKGDGITYDETSIMAAQDKAISMGIGLHFSAGNYLIHAGNIAVKVKWTGQDARIFTKESALYNIMVPIQCENPDISGIVFDQTGDFPMKPDSQGLKGCHIIHAGNYKTLKFNDNELRGYGATLFLSQPYDGYGDSIEVTGNKATWQRQVPDYYDVSVFNIDGLNATVMDNSVTMTKKVDDYKAESGFELHFPLGVVYGNTVTNCINGILHVGWPTLYSKYDAAYPKNLLIENNTMTGCVRDIAFWGDRLYTGREIANVTIRKNKLNMSLARKGSQYYYPATAIGCVNGNADMGIFRNFKIYDNDITTTIEDGLTSNLLDYAPPIDQIGGVNLYSNNQCVTWEIYGNRMSFPYSAHMIRGQKLQHDGISIHNNTMTDCTYRHGYDALARKLDALYTLENCRNVIIKDNTYTNVPDKPLIAVLKKGTNAVYVTM